MFVLLTLTIMMEMWLFNITSNWIHEALPRCRDRKHALPWFIYSSLYVEWWRGGEGGGGLGKKMRKKMAEFDIKGIFIFLELFLMNFSICLCAVQKHWGVEVKENGLIEDKLERPHTPVQIIGFH